ncbi:proto-oncogene tyrosine-protein kinase ROS isoform X2 [Lepeophtheirus salmonis]|uniref:proto-oncogene tyrosine-protein kinase ROS isoform X2 n=1 Tax=Lepeophtheirus salmonis TaxID=72036 RepID=UPI001AE507E0|nr:proto-oncogene tyrosine-protein kinase ROS-like isoform X2 [Lepeophtheirus salmonis]
MAPLTFNGSVAYMVHAKYSGITSVYNTTDLEYELKGLNPNSLYVIWISAYLRTNISKGYSSSKRISIKTFKSPPLVQVLQKGPRSLKLHWKSPNSETPVVFHQFLLYTKYFISKTNVSFNSVIKFFSQNKSDIRWFPSNSAQRTFPSQNYTTQISTGLYPSTMYIIKDEQISSLNEFVWPLDDYMLAVNTLPDTPLEPGIPYIFENGTYVILIWSGGDMNIDLYELYGKEINGDGNFYGWNLIYCDVKNFWPPSMLNDSVYKFKVRAKNEHGWSNFSQSSQFININLILQRKKKSEISILVGSICFSISIFCSIVFYLSFTIIKKTSKNQKSISSISNDLVILNEFRDSFVSANNPLYNLIGENLSPIKHFSLSQLSFKTKLGSGAFGNVYEGTLQCSEHGSRNVALKTLKYNAKEITKKEFIKEALIMSKFNHPNILKLIGTCVDGGPTILVMELMEMDLLELLRSKRSLTDRSTILGKNLVRFCLDIARGCLYLTQMRHVHRDIAARNCLVSLPTSDHTHLVKIGDFGRAREIYRDDYYRKGGLMPIRWMAPESLEDGVYTHQTDVWSYGIVLWEIISFGKQPYPGMSHLDVYHYVCNLRKTLDVPLKCPHILYQLMTQCWSYEPINRPSFKECVDEIEELLLYKDELNGISFTEHIHQLESNSYTKKILNPATLSVTESNVPYLEVISSNNMITNI